MREQKWLRLKKSWPMLKYLRGKVSDRKLWLFVAAFRAEDSLHGTPSTRERLQRDYLRVPPAHRYHVGSHE
jgi:hypothetical protein